MSYLNDEKQFKYFKENVIELLQGKGISKERATNLYKSSGIDERLRNNPDYVLHYNMEFWADWIL